MTRPHWNVSTKEASYRKSISSVSDWNWLLNEAITAQSRIFDELLVFLILVYFIIDELIIFGGLMHMLVFDEFLDFRCWHKFEVHGFTKKYIWRELPGAEGSSGMKFVELWNKNVDY